MIVCHSTAAATCGRHKDGAGKDDSVCVDGYGDDGRGGVLELLLLPRWSPLVFLC